jgi:hypothetical protein
MKPFIIKITEQSWSDKDPKNTTDPCSHGSIILQINGEDICTEEDGAWSVSIAGLQLLRSAFSDFSHESDFPMIPHCGMFGMIGCPISISWSVVHRDNKVHLSNIYKVSSTDEKDIIHYPDATTELMLIDYIRPILRLTDDVAYFFEKAPPRSFENVSFSPREYLDFRDEFNDKRTCIRSLLKQLKKESE